MKAVRCGRYGPPGVLRLQEAGMSAVGDGEVLVRVRAAPVNPLDWHFMRGAPYLVRILAGLSRPRASARQLGAGMAGSVEAAGKNVTRFQPGDEVFGGLEERGTLAEYLRVRQHGAIPAKPASLTFAQAAAVPVAGVTPAPRVIPAFRNARLGRSGAVRRARRGGRCPACCRSGRGG
jgi:NADPH:quinone reductase-like Zn-dependent oxidoreductase